MTNSAAVRTIVVGIPLAERHLQRLRDRFPQVEFVVATGDTLSGALAEADAALSWRLSADQLAGAPKLRWLQTVGAGVDSVLIPELAERGIAVTNNSGVHGPNIAEHVMAMMLAFARQLPFLVRAQIAGEWRDQATRERTFEVGGQTLALIGLGRIAQAVAVRASAFGMTIVGVRRRTELPVPEHVSEVFPIDRLGDALALADHVVVTLPLTRRTRQIIDATQMARMKPTAYIYNIGRGPVIDQKALVAALSAGQLAGAGLDVTDPEPLPADSPLWAMPNVLITAHTSGSTPRYWDRAIEVLEANVDRFVSGRPLINQIDPSEGY